KAHKKVAIFSDALSVHGAFQDPKKEELKRVTITLTQLSTKTKLTIQWIPARCGVLGNEIADRLAKE
ncbi:hypothetical protein BaRGS_00005367, partial [Batillaria attramentaria]